MARTSRTLPAAKHPGGRPEKPEAERRSKQVKIRLTLHEEIELRRAAEIAGMSVAEFIRRRTLGIPVRPPPSRADAQMLVELNAIGNNLNQLVRNIHTDRSSDHAPECDEVLRELQRVLRKVGSAIA